MVPLILTIIYESRNFNGLLNNPFLDYNENIYESRNFNGLLNIKLLEDERESTKVEILMVS